MNPIFGTNEDLEELFSKAKDLGLKIILDFVSFSKLRFGHVIDFLFLLRFPITQVINTIGSLDQQGMKVIISIITCGEIVKSKMALSRFTQTTG